MSLLITGVLDGPLTGGVPKAIEITVLSDVPDLSVYALESANNGGAASGAEFTFPAVSASAGDVIYVSYDSAGFADFFGFAPDYTGGVASINGDDAVLLYENGTVVDAFGTVGEDGTGTAWDYLDGWAYRKDGATPSASFDASQWTFSGINALDGETTNGTAATPFPAGSYEPGETGPVVVAFEGFDDDAVNLISGFEAEIGNRDGGPGDWFGVGSLGAWPQASGVPFSLTDDSVFDVSGGGVNAGDAEGIFGVAADPDNAFFALSDSDEFGTLQTASWSFDILGYSDLMLSIDMGGISDASFGGYSLTDTEITFTLSIDGGESQTAFEITAVAGSFVTRPMDSGNASGGGSLLSVAGDNEVIKLLAEDGSAADNVWLDKAVVDTGALDSFLTAIDGTGAVLTLTLTANLPFEAMAFDNITITGTETGVTGSVFAIAAEDAVKAEGDSGTTEFTFTVTRSGDISAAASVDYGVSGDVEAADFGGTLPAGTVSFAAGEASATITLAVSGDEILENDESFTVSLSNPVGGNIAAGSAEGQILNDDLEVTLISAIQGNAATWGEQFGRTDATPFFGATVMVSAIVVGDFQNDGDADSGNLGGFYLQEEDADSDGDATTSEGIFIYQNGLPTGVQVGDRVTVIGTATEYFGETQINATEIIVESSDNALPTAAEITFPIANVIENPDGLLIADLEAYEGMLVSIEQDMTVADLFDYGRFGEIGLSATGRLETYTQSHAPDVEGFADYTEAAVKNTVTLDDGLTSQNPATLPYPDGAYATGDGLSSGDTVSEITGVVRYSRSSGSTGDENYRINPVEAPVFTDTDPRQETPPEMGGSLKVASFNVLNYFNGDGEGGGFPTSRGADSAEEFARQTDKLVAAISAIDADVVGLIEIENDGYGSDSAIASLVDALNAAMGAGTYAYVDPGVDRLGSDEIAVGFIYKADAVELVGDAAILDKTVDARFDSDNMRPSLAQTFREIDGGGTFTAVVNHLKSKGSPVDGVDGDIDQHDGAGNANETRTLAAQALADWIATDPTHSGDKDVLVIGDLNSYAAEDPIQALLAGSDDVLGTADDLTQLHHDYTYGYPLDLNTAGQVQSFGTLDYALGSGSLTTQVTGAAAWHINSDEPGFIDYNTEFKPDNPDFYAPDAFRSSDHDPVIVGLDLDPETVLARVEFVESRGRDKAVYSLDGETVATEAIRLVSKTLSLDHAGVTITADDGIRLSPELIESIGQGLGIYSVLGDRFLSSAASAIDGKEVMSFALDDQPGLGDATEVGFEFATTKGSGQVVLSFYDDDALVETVALDVVDGAVAYDLAGSASFDRVDLGVTGSLQVAVEALDLHRLAADSFDFVS